MLKRLVFIILLSLFFYPQVSFGITIGPSRFEVSLPPGEIAVADYYVQNETDAPIHVVVEPENWFKDAYIYGDLSVENWIEFDTYEFDLEPMEIKKLKLTIRVPEDRTGELVAQIFFTSAAVGESKLVGTVRARLGAVLYVAIKGTEIVDAEIEDINVTKETSQDKEGLKIGVAVRNRGNVHLRPTGKILIENQKGERVAELDLVSGMAVHPNKDQIYYSIWSEEKFKKGKYNTRATINYGKIFGVEKSATFERAFAIDEEGRIDLK